VLPDGSPDWDNRVFGTTVDISAQGIGLELGKTPEFATTAVVLLVAAPDGTQRCAGLDVMHTSPVSRGRVKVGGRFGGFADQLLLPENLVPTFQPKNMEFTLGQPEEVLRKWAEIGVLQPVVLDRVQMCPKCRGLLTFRRGCRQCGSVHLSNDRLIHHFACAHVGLAADFETPAGLRCPKCLTRNLIVAADFDHLVGPYRCHDCHWSDSELEAVAQCLRCQFRFPGSQAEEIELRGYRVNRLDPQALLPAP
jgi:hypothetical protein